MLACRPSLCTVLVILSVGKPSAQAGWTNSFGKLQMVKRLLLVTACIHTHDILQALKERLVERANIIQARHDSETAALVKRQVQHYVCHLAYQHGHSTAWHDKYICTDVIACYG